METYRRPREEMDFQVWVDTFDIVEHSENFRRGLVDVELAE